MGPVAVAGWQARKSSPSTPPPTPTREKVHPASVKRPILGCFERAGRTFSRSHPPPDHAGRTFSRSGRTEVVTVKPTTPLQPLIQASVKPPSPMLAPEQHPLKPTTPMQPKNAPKTPISHPQRRWRFQLRLGLCPQRRWRFQLPLDLRPQRRQRFQTARPPGRQGLAAAAVGGGGAWPGDQLTADVTNVVNPSTKTTIISEKALRLTTFVTTRTRPPQKLNTRDPHDAPRERRGLARLRDNAPSHTPATQPHWCEGRRRDRRARASCKTGGLAAAPVGDGA